MTEPVRSAEPTHLCLRCGTLVLQAISLCKRSNPGRLAQQAAAQAHSTTLLGIGIAVIVPAVITPAVIVPAVVAQFLVGGVGRFPAG